MNRTFLVAAVVVMQSFHIVAESHKPFSNHFALEKYRNYSNLSDAKIIKKLNLQRAFSTKEDIGGRSFADIFKRENAYLCLAYGLKNQNSFFKSKRQRSQAFLENAHQLAPELYSIDLFYLMKYNKITTSSKLKKLYADCNFNAQLINKELNKKKLRKLARHAEKRQAILWSGKVELP